MAERCYTYVCSNTTNLMPSGKAEYCEECFAMIEPYEKACNELGIEPWDETFVVFRAGFLAAGALGVDS